MIIACITAIGTALLASLAGFALSRLKFRYSNVLFWVILAGIMIPGQVLIVPQFRELDSFHLLNTFWAVSAAADPDRGRRVHHEAVLRRPAP